MLVVGSSAMAWHGLTRPSKFKKTLKDIDVIAYPSEVNMFNDCEVIKEKPNKTVYKSDDMYFEVEWANPDTNQEKLLKLLNVKPNYGFYDAPKEVLYALKMSHRFLKNSPHFLKTMQDIHLMREAWGVGEGSAVDGIAGYLEEWYHQRLNDTYTYSHPKLNQSKEDFFSTDVFDGKQVYVYDHDTLHEAVKIYNKPAYTYFTDDEVRVSRKMFEEISYGKRLASVVEESCVLALERAMIPHGTNQDKAFMIALEKVCTSIASGWWRNFAWENYRQALALYKNCEFDLKKDLQRGLDEGIVKPFKQ